MEICNNVCSKIYYKKDSGEIILTTPEVKIGGVLTNKEEDYIMQKALQIFNIDDIEYITLPYGTLATAFKNAKTYSINLDTKELEVTYYTEDELKEIQKQEEESQVGSNRVEDIKSYLDNADDTTISKVEDTILETESNKIINGGI